MSVEHVTVPERYARAFEAASLAVDPLRQGDVDVLIAAGWVRQSIGTALFRTRSEYDSCNKQELARAGGDLTARVLVMSQLQSLRYTKLAVAAWAIFMADKSGLRMGHGEIIDIANKALHAWLEPHCQKCGGRGEIGMFGKPRRICPACNGSTLRYARMHKTDEGHEFGRRLLTAMDRRADAVDAVMQRYLRSR